MLKRTPPNKLTLYRRHAESLCPIKKSTILDQCECPVWAHGKLRGEFTRFSLNTRSLDVALRKKHELLTGDGPDGPKGGLPQTAKENITIEQAVVDFQEAKKRRAASSVKLYRAACESFLEWCAKHGLVYLRDVDTPHIQKYFDEVGRDWQETTLQSRLIHLRVFFNYAQKRRLIQFSPAQNIDSFRTGTAAATRQPFTPDEITRILAAVERMPAKNRDRARALILLLLYTGMRISDATFFERDFLTKRNTADYHVIKTRSQISLPPELQKPAVDALAKLPKSRVYFFQPDRDDNYREARTALRHKRGEFSQLMPGYRARVEEMIRLVRKVLALAKLDGACHRFRDTFAINLLVNGADIFTVSQMLGHSDVKITQSHYMKLIPGYRERMSQSTRVLSYNFPLQLAS